MFDLNSIRLRRRWLYPSLGLFAMMAALSALTANSLRKPIHWIAQKTLGRDLWIDGDLSVSLGKVIVIRAHGLRLANRAGAAQPEMLQVEHLALGLDPWATLRHLRVVLTRAEIDNLRILVERDETGRLNWNFASETQESSSQSEPENSERQNKSDSSLPLTVQSVSLRKGSATIFEKVILLDALDAAFPSDLARFLAFSSGKIDKNSWTLNADVNNIHLERPQFDNLEVQARVEALDASLEATGKLSGLNFSGQTHLKGKNLKQALMIIGYEMNGEITSYEAKAYLHFERPRLTLQDLSASFNDSTLRDAFSGDFGTPIAIKADLDSESLVFRDFGAFLPAAVGRETPGARLKGAPNGGNDPEKPEETKLFSTKPIQLGGKNFPRIDVALDARRFKGDGKAALIESLRFRVKAHAGLLAVTDFAAKLAGGRVEAAVSLKSPDPGANVPSQDLTALASVRLKNIDLGRLTAEFVKDAHKVKKVANVSVEKLLVGKLTAALDAQSRGSHMAALMAALNGEVGLVVEDGVASAVLIEALGLDLSQALSDVWTAKKYVAMPCAVAKIRFVRGVGTVEKVVLSTSDSDVSLVGDVNLGGETFDFKIEAHPKDPSLGSLRIPILARGPFADPKVSIDGREAGVKVLAGVILGAITPAAAALVLLEPGDQPKGICTELKPMISAIKRKEQTAVSR